MSERFAAMTSTCKNCGTSFPAGDPFCPTCGKPQPIVATEESVLEPPATTGDEGPAESAPAAVDGGEQSPEEEPKRRTLWRATGSCLLAFVCIVLIFLAIGGVAVYQGLQERAVLNIQQAAIHYQRGVAHLEAKEYELAVAEFEHTLRLDPSHREAREALRESKTIAVAQPTPTSATLNEAIVAILAEAETLAGEEKWPETIERLVQLRDLAPDFEAQKVADMLYTANFKLGMQLVGQGQVAEAVRAFEQALAERPGDAEASRQLDLASLYTSAETTWGADWPSTIGFLVELYTLTPDYLDVKTTLYEAYEQYGDALVAEEAWCLAEVQYKEAAALQPGSAAVDKWSESGRLCRAPTATPVPAGTRAPSIAGASPATVTAGSAESRPTASGSILFSRFNLNDQRWEILAVTQDQDAPAFVMGDATQPAASYNGQLIAYHAELNESEGLHVFNVSSSEDVRATTFREDVIPDWAPDNLRFVFPSQRSGDRRWQIYIGFADGKGDPVPLVDGRTPAWSPEGTLIAYQGSDVQGNNPGLYLVSPQGGPAARLTQGESDRAPAWSPECARAALILTDQGVTSPASAASQCRIAFMSSSDGNWEIYSVEVLTGQLTRLTQSGTNDGLPTWSPDGRSIAFVSDRDGWGVYTMPATGGKAVKVADWGDEHSDWLVERIAWVR
jgi:tetratricopeptide (TPR) repeat protein